MHKCNVQIYCMGIYIKITKALYAVRRMTVILYVQIRRYIYTYTKVLQEYSRNAFVTCVSQRNEWFGLIIFIKVSFLLWYVGVWFGGMCMWRLYAYFYIYQPTLTRLIGICTIIWYWNENTWIVTLNKMWNLVYSIGRNTISDS